MITGKSDMIEVEGRGLVNAVQVIHPAAVVGLIVRKSHIVEFWRGITVCYSSPLFRIATHKSDMTETG